MRNKGLIESTSYATQVEKFKNRHTYDRATQENASLFYANNWTSHPHTQIRRVGALISEKESHRAVHSPNRSDGLGRFFKGPWLLAPHNYCRGRQRPSKQTTLFRTTNLMTDICEIPKPIFRKKLLSLVPPGPNDPGEASLLHSDKVRRYRSAIRTIRRLLWTWSHQSLIKLKLVVTHLVWWFCGV